jgi:hypothetical protein
LSRVEQAARERVSIGRCAEHADRVRDRTLGIGLLASMRLKQTPAPEAPGADQRDPRLGELARDSSI